MPVQFSLDDEVLALLDDWRQYTNNRTRPVDELVALAAEATGATGKDDPRETLRELLEEHPSYARDSGYDPAEEDHQLDSNELREMCLRDPLPPINSAHVIPPELRQMNTWTKAGIIAGAVRSRGRWPWSGSS